MRCHWVKSADVPGGRFLVPGCCNRAVYGDNAECHCPPEVNASDPMAARVKRLERVVEMLEEALAEMRAGL